MALSINGGVFKDSFIEKVHTIFLEENTRIEYVYKSSGWHIVFIFLTRDIDASSVQKYGNYESKFLTHKDSVYQVFILSTP